MKDGLNTLLSENHKSGIFWLASQDSVSTIADIVKLSGFRFMFLDGIGITTGREFLVQIANIIECPYMAGTNWNQLLDCMRDFSWFSDDSGFVLFYDNVDQLVSNELWSFGVSIETLEDVIEFWNTESIPAPLYVLLRGGSNFLTFPEVSS